jgi:hypothetical protein
MIWHVIGAVGDLGAVPSCCFAVICRGLTLDTSGGKDIWTLVGAQKGMVPDAAGEVVVVCTLGGGEPRGVGDTLGGSMSSRWGCKGGALGM